ncbi:MAG: LapA family protein [Pseudomonadota bacterium]
MKKVKILLWIILLGITALIVYQNKTFFLEKHSFTVNFFVGDILHSPEWPNIAWFLACFFLGLLIAYFFSLMERFRSNKTIKDLNAKTESLLDMISQLRKELESRKSPMATTPVIEVEPESTPDRG